MQENSLTTYARITSVKNPVATGQKNGKGDPVYTITATGTTLCGSTRNPETGNYEQEFREIDLVFSNITARHGEMLSEGCEIMVHDGVVISYEASVNYPRRLFHLLTTEETTAASLQQPGIVDFLVDAVTKAHPNLPFDEVAKQLNTLIQQSRRKTIVRVMPGQWSLKASPKQIANAQAVDAEDFSLQ